jgi:hypothetical protein
MFIKPRNKVLGSMPVDEVERTPVCLGVQWEPGRNKLFVKVAFQSVRLKQRLGKGGGWCVAAKGADIYLYATNGTLSEASKGASIQVTYKVRSKATKDTAVKVGPKLKAGPDVEVGVGDVRIGRGREEEVETEHVANETMLATTTGVNSVHWQQSLDRGQKAIRDYCFFDLDLSAICKWEAPPRNGTLRLEPNLSVFDRSGHEVSAIKVILTMRALYRRTIQNEDGISISFQVSNYAPGSK